MSRPPREGFTRLLQAVGPSSVPPSRLKRKVMRLEIYDPALDADHRRMCPVVGSELGEDVLDPALHGVFSDRQLIGDLLVGIASGNQTEHVNFCGRQRVIGRMLGKL